MIFINPDSYRDKKITMETTEVNTKIKWVIDPARSEIGFKAKYLVFTNVRGSFKEFDASIYTTGEDFLSAEVDFWINPASINTGEEKRDAHLRSADFFDVENFKEINFTAGRFKKVDNDGNYELYGNLTMKGIKKQIKLEVEFSGVIKDPWGNHKAVFSINGKINRKDWGLNWNAALETGGVLVSEDVWISCEIQLAKQS
ncbi:MAG TPA: YceI family protein [Chitinophagaceae bacterium]|nr:YceI family protein [Chitinophagaceae bacterium]